MSLNNTEAGNLISATSACASFFGKLILKTMVYKLLFARPDFDDSSAIFKNLNPGIC